MYQPQVRRVLLVIFILFSNCLNSVRCGCDSIHRTSVDLQPCSQTKIFFDQHSNYLKSVCEVRQLLNYYDAEKFCFDRGMELLIVENEAVYDSLNSFVLERYPGLPVVWNDSHGLWMNGRFDGADWFVFKNFRKNDIGKGIKIAYEHQIGGECAALKRNVHFELRPYGCTNAYHFLCEYQSALVYCGY